MLSSCVLLIRARLIAIMLGRLEMTVDECIEAYVQMMDLIFAKEKSRRFNFKGDARSRFDTAVLEEAIKNVIERSRFPNQTSPDILMRDPDRDGCKT